MEIVIKSMEPNDWSEVARIYLLGIQTKKATFETTTPSYEQWDADHISSCRLVAWEKEQIIGWATLSAVSKREAYRGVAEVSVYIDHVHNGKGIGSKLLTALIIESEVAGFWTLQAGIFPENEASIHLHQKLGFRRIGIRKNIAKMDGIWRDNVILERRSDKF